MKKKAKALKRDEVEQIQRNKHHAIKMRSTELQGKQNLEKENFKKKIQIELQIMEREKLKAFTE